ncbi:hypothetical protein JZ751_012756 [Albula glossodonta]|uniref:Snake toxin/toxin-like domain-containing protein n=1 Tax=Albula glossodonta TaxID=121402 RepID=A0A8T2NA12_9TELE|nr:hypothetical protein JZ751_012756 [Albula glossodonta]
MKLLLSSMLLALVCTSLVQSLRCYTCDDDPKCMTQTDCSAESSFCKTVTTDDTLDRGCAEKCVESYYVSCCETDLCNL